MTSSRGPSCPSCGGFGEADGNRVLPALHLTALAAPAAGAGLVWDAGPPAAYRTSALSVCKRTTNLVGRESHPATPKLKVLTFECACAQVPLERQTSSSPQLAVRAPVVAFCEYTTRRRGPERSPQRRVGRRSLGYCTLPLRSPLTREGVGFPFRPARMARGPAQDCDRIIV
jgi:hypothetical protein